MVHNVTKQQQQKKKKKKQQQKTKKNKNKKKTLVHAKKQRPKSVCLSTQCDQGLLILLVYSTIIF